jgi:hypothetical protein
MPESDTDTEESTEQQTPEPELRHPGLEPSQERALSNRSREPESSNDEESEDNDGGPPSSRR